MRQEQDKPISVSYSLACSPSLSVSLYLCLSLSMSLSMLPLLGIAHLAESRAVSPFSFPNSSGLSLSPPPPPLLLLLPLPIPFAARRMAHYAVHLSGHYSKFDLDASLESCPSHIINTKVTHRDQEIEEQGVLERGEGKAGRGGYAGDISNT